MDYLKQKLLVNLPGTMEVKQISSDTILALTKRQLIQIKLTFKDDFYSVESLTVLIENDSPAEANIDFLNLCLVTPEELVIYRERCEIGETSVSFTCQLLQYRYLADSWQKCKEHTLNDSLLAFHYNEKYFVCDNKLQLMVFSRNDFSIYAEHRHSTTVNGMNGLYVRDDNSIYRHLVDTGTIIKTNIAKLSHHEVMVADLQWTAISRQYGPVFIMTIIQPTDNFLMLYNVETETARRLPTLNLPNENYYPMTNGLLVVTLSRGFIKLRILDLTNNQNLLSIDSKAWLMHYSAHQFIPIAADWLITHDKLCACIWNTRSASEPILLTLYSSQNENEGEYLCSKDTKSRRPISVYGSNIVHATLSGNVYIANIDAKYLKEQLQQAIRAMRYLFLVGKQTENAISLPLEIAERVTKFVAPDINQIKHKRILSLFFSRPPIEEKQSNELKDEMRKAYLGFR